MISISDSVKALVHSLCWLLGFWLTYFIMAHSSSKEAYGVIIGWWFACYIGFVSSIGIKVAIPAYILYVSVCVISSILGYPWFYHDAPEFGLSLFFIILVQGIVFISPIAINEFTRMIGKRLKYS